MINRLGSKKSLLAMAVVAVAIGVLFAWTFLRPSTQKPVFITEYQMAAFMGAMKAYRLDYAAFPPAENLADRLLQTNGKMYIEYDPRVIAEGKFMDQWKVPIAIDYPSSGSVLLKSSGPDKVFETSDDIEKRIVF